MNVFWIFAFCLVIFRKEEKYPNVPGSYYFTKYLVFTEILVIADYKVNTNYVLS